MQIYLINLTRRPDRLAQMNTALKALGLPYIRIEAVDGMDADIGRPAGHSLPAPAYACYLSHLKAYRAFLATDDSHCVIMEDDVALSPRFPEALAARHFYSDQNGIIRLEAPTNIHWRKPSYSWPKAVMQQKGLATYRLISKSLGTGAFVLPRKIAKAILAQQAPPEMPIDLRLFHQQRSGHLGFDILQFSPALALQRQFLGGADDSDIEPDRLRTLQRPKTHPLFRNLHANLRRIVNSGARLTGFIRRFPFADT